MSTPAWKIILDQLETGERRAAFQNATGEWQADKEVKQAILTAFKESSLIQMGDFVDKDTLPVRQFRVSDQVRVVPGGTAIRRGAFVAPGVIIMPPAYINIGAFVDEGTLVDSHALVGSCAQVGKHVHLSAAAQIGGVLEPIGAKPVIVEDNAFVGGNTGLYEGVIIGKRAIIAAGVVLTGSTPIYDLVQETTWTGQVPENAVVVPGSRPAKGAFARTNNLNVQAAIIVKYRDAKTDSKTALESALRGAV